MFCGSITKAKSCEHVLPQWLIKETGASDRIASFGLDMKTLKAREFAFDQFKFPACHSCNNIYSTIEGKVQQIIRDVINESPLSASDFELLLTWLDKVRIGLWLGFRYLNGNVHGINPQFFINQRIDNKDRALFIYKTDSMEKGLSFVGPTLPLYAYYPSCFGLRINNTVFINISSDFLISRRLGLPYPISSYLINSYTNKTECTMAFGLERILEPVFRISFDRSCTEIYQPIIPRELEDCLSMDMYLRPYVNNFFRTSRIGKLLIKRPNSKISDYPFEKTTAWIPMIKHPIREASYILERTTLILNKFLITHMPSFDHLEDKNEINHQRKIYLSCSRKLLKRCEREIKRQ